jgi:hypothetical protein
MHASSVLLSLALALPTASLAGSGLGLLAAPSDFQCLTTGESESENPEGLRCQDVPCDNPSHNSCVLRSLWLGDFQWAHWCGCNDEIPEYGPCVRFQFEVWVDPENYEIFCLCLDFYECSEAHGGTCIEWLDGEHPEIYIKCGCDTSE